MYLLKIKEVLIWKQFWEERRYLYTGGQLYVTRFITGRRKKETNIGVWAMRHKRYLKQNHKLLYYNLLTSDKLNSYLADIEQQAQDLFLRLVKDLTEQENITEHFKATNMLAWVQVMNNISNRAREIVYKKIVYIH